MIPNMESWIELVDGSPLVDVTGAFPKCLPEPVFDMWLGRVVRCFEKPTRKSPMLSRLMCGQLAVPVKPWDEIAAKLLVLEGK